jgi:pimeloyl-ACP methyl ester carboxylesterase
VLIWGESDRLIAPAYADAFLRHLPQAGLVRIPKAGHMAAYEQTEAVVEAIARLA